MRSCSPALCVLILLITTFTTESESCFNSVTVKLHDSATLSCTGTCQVARWSLLSNFNDTLAECDQTSCRSVKEGYQMIHHQYLRGNLSLIIAKADLSMTTSYLCKCDKQNICYVTLQTERDRSDLDTDRGAAVPVWVTVLLVVLVAVIVGSVVMNMLQRKKNRQLRMRNEGNGVELNGLRNHHPVNERQPLQNNDQELRENH